MSEAEKIIYSMYKVSKHYNRKAIITDISLSYFYGAKIGVLGLNGSGKSSLLRIMAGTDSEYEGTISIQPGFTVGFLEQEPELEKGKTVKEIVEEGVQETVELLREYEDINAQFAEPMDDDAMNALIERQASVAEQLDAVGAWDLDSRLDMAMDALRCPPEDQRGLHALGRRAAAGGPVSAVAPPAGYPAPRRADQPPRRRDSSVAGGAFASVPGDGNRRHPRPVFSRQCGGLDSGAGPRTRRTVEGKLLVVVRTEEGAPAAGRKERERTTADAGARAGVDSHDAEGQAAEEQG